MPEVFINYRTGDGEHVAGRLHAELSRRFGKDRIFLASQSIKPSMLFPAELSNGVRRSSVLIAVIDKDWVISPKLNDENDWVRREILEAFHCGIPVFPVLVGRKAERLCSEKLPEALASLADREYLTFDSRTAPSDIARIGDALTDLVPSLRTTDTAAPQRPTAEPGAVDNSTGDVHGTVVQGRDINGDVGTVVKGNHGTVHAGKGDIHNTAQYFAGDVGTQFNGPNFGEISNNFGTARRRKDEEDER